MNSDWLTEIACEARDRYASLVMPYECKKIPVPKDVLRQALAYLAIADEADKQWKKLLGLDQTPLLNQVFTERRNDK